MNQIKDYNGDNGDLDLISEREILNVQNVLDQNKGKWIRLKDLKKIVNYSNNRLLRILGILEKDYDMKINYNL